MHSVDHFYSISVPDFVEKLKLDVKKKTKPSKSHSRKKRQYRSPRIEPELLLFVDHALFRAFEGDSNELLEYLLHFWHAVSFVTFWNFCCLWVSFVL
jgi:hypothetical protein